MEIVEIIDELTEQILSDDFDEYTLDKLTDAHRVDQEAITKQKTIEKVYEWISNYNAEKFPFTNLDIDGHCEPDMKAFAEELKKYLEG